MVTSSLMSRWTACMSGGLSRRHDHACNNCPRTHSAASGAPAASTVWTISQIARGTGRGPCTRARRCRSALTTHRFNPMLNKTAAATNRPHGLQRVLDGASPSCRPTAARTSRRNSGGAPRGASRRSVRSISSLMPVPSIPIVAVVPLRSGIAWPACLGALR